MKSRPTLRGLHAWWSIGLALPVFVVSLTAVLLAHEDTLGLKANQAPSALRALLPSAPAITMPEIRGSAQQHDGKRYIGTRAGVLVLDSGSLQPVAELSGLDVRAIASVGPNLWVATKSGVWLRNQTWSRVLKADAWSIETRPDGEIAVGTKENGFLLTKDGRDWRTDGGINASLSAYAASAGATPITWQKLVLDMHTGRAFVGKEYEWLWIDLLGGTLLFLTVSGFIMWWRSHRRMLIVRAGRTSSTRAARSATR